MPDDKSIVLELQRLATEPSVDICELLRKALLVATKLKQEDFRSWVNAELSGYGDDPVPSYRKIKAEIVLNNPYHGFIPVLFGDNRLEDAFTSVDLRDSIGSLFEALRRTESGGYLHFPLSPSQVAHIMKMPDNPGLPPIKLLAVNVISGIIDRVKTVILEWSLKLEEQGILGKGMSFSADEKERASGNPNISIGQFQGIMGDVSASSVMQNMTLRINKGSMEDIRSYLRSLGLPEDDLTELQTALESDPKPTKPGQYGARVGAWVGKMVSKAATGAWQVTLTAAGDLLSKAISAYYGLP